jgi:ParB-like chromosome segregation protein Spo0J
MEIKPMPIKMVKIDKLKINPSNPRVIKDYKYKKLLKSITEFPEMLMLRPIVVDNEMVILGGNQRYRACQEAGLKEVPIILVSELSQEQIDRFVITDNVSFGDWDYDILANNWDSELIDASGLDLWQQPADVDYSLLDDASGGLDNLISDMADGVKKAIQIEFEAEHYEEAQALIKFWREQKMYIGGVIIEKLKEEKNKLK